MSQWLRDELGDDEHDEDDNEDFDDDDDNNESDDDDDDEDEDDNEVASIPVKASGMPRKQPQQHASKISLELSFLNDYATNLHDDELLRALESGAPVAFLVGNESLSASVPKMYPRSVAKVKCVSAQVQKVVNGVAARRSKHRPATLSAMFAAVLEHSQRQESMINSTRAVATHVSSSDNSNNGDVAAIANESEDEWPTIDFFEAKRTRVPLTLSQSIYVVVNTLLDAKERKLTGWLDNRELQRQAVSSASGGRRAQRKTKDPRAGGFDERMSIMLMELLGEQHPIALQCAAFENSGSAIAQYANQVVDGLWIGPLHAGQDEKFLDQARIGAIVSVGDFSPMFPHKIAYCQAIARDRANESMRPVIEKCVAFIAEKRAAGVNVLVHCLGGRSRSATVVAAYLVLQHQMSFARALATIVSVRPIVSPNAGFLRTLRDL